MLLGQGTSLHPNLGLGFLTPFPHHVAGTGLIPHAAFWPQGQQGSNESTVKGGLPLEHPRMALPGPLGSPLMFLGSFLPLQAIPWKWLFGATAVALGGVALSVVIAARN